MLMLKKYKPSMIGALICAIGSSLFVANHIKASHIKEQVIFVKSDLFKVASSLDMNSSRIAPGQEGLNSLLETSKLYSESFSKGVYLSDEGKLTAVFGGDADESLAGHSIWLQRANADSGSVWNCFSDLPNQFLPDDCSRES